MANWVPDSSDINIPIHMLGTDHFISVSRVGEMKNNCRLEKKLMLAMTI